MHTELQKIKENAKKTGRVADAIDKIQAALFTLQDCDVEYAWLLSGVVIKHDGREFVIESDGNITII